MSSPHFALQHLIDGGTSASPSSRMMLSMSPSSNSSSSLSNLADRATPTSAYFPVASPSSANASVSGAHGPMPTRSVSASTPTIRSPPSGGGSQTKRHSVRLPDEASMDRSASSSSTGFTTAAQPSTNTLPPPQPRPTSPITSPSIHKSITALDAKSITQNMEKSQHMRGDEIITSPSSPGGASMTLPSFYFANASNQSIIASSYQSIAPPVTPSASHFQYPRQGSISSVTLSTVGGPHVPGGAPLNTSNDVWPGLCVRVLPLFNGEGVQGSIEDLNEMLRRCLTDPVSPQLHHNIEALLRDGMFTLNAKMFGVTDEKLLDRLVEQWSFFFTYALPYFEAVFLPLRADVRYRSEEEAEAWNVRNMALRSFRDNVILLQTKRLEDVFAKLFTDFGSSQNPAATAAKMLQMTSLLASVPDQNEEIERVLSNLKANWKIMMTKRDRRGFAGVRRAQTGDLQKRPTGWKAAETSNIFGALL